MKKDDKDISKKLVVSVGLSASEIENGGVYDSYIADINEANRITVNGTRINAPPYIIKAIGNTTYLESAVSQKKYGYIDVKISEGKNVTLERQESSTIPRYNKYLILEYVKGEE